MTNENTRNNPADSFAYLEPYLGDASNVSNKVEAFTSPVRITFIHTRARLADIDGLSGKAVIDGLVSCGILTDDSAKQVEEVNHRQVKGKPEGTKVIIEEIVPQYERTYDHGENGT